MATLTGNEIQNTYQGLLKTSDNAIIGSSLKQITDGLGNSTSLFVSTDKLEVSGSISQVDLGLSTFIGYQAGANDDLSNNANCFIGYNSGRDNQTGGSNVSAGFSSFMSNTTGNNNTSMGYASLYGNTTGTANTAFGYQSLRSNTVGVSNVSIGDQSSYFNTTGLGNTSIGSQSLRTVVGDKNVSLGYNSGRYISDGSTALTLSDNSIFIGHNSKALVDNSINEIVIGNEAVGNGNNTVMLGGSSITKTTLNGDIGIGTLSPESLLDVASTTKVSSPFPRMTSAQKTAIGSPVIGGHIYQTDGTEGVYVYKSTGWELAY